MRTPRPNPFTSWEGCLLSSTVWGISFVLAFVGGAYLGSLFDNYQATTICAVIAGSLVSAVPWRQWVIRAIKGTQGPQNPGGDEGSTR